MRHVRDEKIKMQDTCVAFGAFDGVHLGHRAVMDSLVACAMERGLAPALLSFDSDAGGLDEILTSEEEKAWLLREAALDTMVSMPAQAANEAFVREVLVGQLGAKVLVVGENHADLPLLREYGGKYNFDVIECEMVLDEGAPVSTQRAAAALKAGELDAASRLMGHPPIVVGRVVRGKQLGRTIGQPTANIDFVQGKLLPPDGSYVTMTVVDGERRVGSVHIGKRPTVDNFDYKTVENFIYDFSGDLYGKVLVMEIHRFIRGVWKFNNLEEVRVQCAKDVQAIRDYIASVK